MKVYRISGVILSVSGLALAVFYLLLSSGSIITNLLKPLSLLTVILGFTATSISFSGKWKNPTRDIFKISHVPYLIISITLVSINLVLFFFNQFDFFVYYVFNSIIYVFSTLILNSLKYKPVYTFNVISTVLFIGFFGVLGEKIYSIVS
ncbi:TPA: hypothetical protein ENX78_17270 [Candidatus Poribacteria bacterium]|nr:hypothetical protein [Candidatus Poribacteria bacterium]